jgi:uncharacterized protein YciI
MPSFFLKLTPPRPTFAVDMSEDERAIMTEHLAFMNQHFAAGRVLIFGPVMDPAGVYGMAVLDAKDQAEAEAIMRKDPSVARGVNRLDIYPMRIGGAQGQRVAG